jgi:type VI secretion system VasD/TssJ family lipoprotein
MRAKSFGSQRLAGLGVAAALSVAACSHAPAAGSPPPPPPGAPACTTPEPLAVSLTASSRLNPGDKGEPLTTVVRLYQLKGREKLTGASFDEMLDRDKETLGEDLLSVQELTVSPGETLRPAVNRNADAGYLAAVALFRRPGTGAWRAIRKLSGADPDHCHRGGAAGAGKPAPARDEARFILDENRVELR